MLTYTVELKPQEEGGYTATVPAFPGCISEGETAKEALENIKEAIEGCIEVLIKHNRKVPLEFSDFRQVEIFQNNPKKKKTSSSKSNA